GKGVIGFSYAVPNSIAEDQDQSFDNITTTINRFNINFNNDDNTYNFGPSYAFKVNEHLSLGATLYVHYRHIQRISNTLIEYRNGERTWTNNYFETTESGTKPMVGLTWSPRERWSLGISATQVMLFRSDTTQYESSGVVTRRAMADQTKSQYPLNVNLGIAYFHSSSLLLAADINYFSRVGEAEEQRERVINFALGVEYYLTPHWVVRSGFFTDLANTPELQQNITAYNQLEHIDLYGISASIGHFTRTSSISFGFSYSLGSGQAQMVGGNATLQEAELNALALYLSTAYAY
ncbi:MAG: aromatic hydrocarbon degradation membrane protein, partial [Halothiobacillaceae bacterium]